MSTSAHRYYSSEVSRLVRDRLDALSDRKGPKDIAKEIGYKDERLLLGFADGEFRVPLDKALQFARVLETDPAIFYSLVLESYGLQLEGIKIVNDPPWGASRPSVDLNFKVDPEFHRLFKTEAVLRGISMKELLETALKAFLSDNS